MGEKTMNDITICSIAPFSRHWERTHGRYRMEAGSLEKPATMIVGDATDKYWTDIEKNQSITVPVQARDIVNDLLQMDERRQGFFEIEGDEPTAEEIDMAKETQLAYYTALVRAGDTSWAQHGKHEHISDSHRRAAKALGIEREWATILRERIDCPGCGSSCLAHVAFCGQCKTIINKEAYEKLETADQGARPQAYEDLSAGKELPQEPVQELPEGEKPQTTA